MSEEEKKAIEYLKKYIKWETYGERSLESDIKTTLNYISKLQKENKKQKEKVKFYKEAFDTTSKEFEELRAENEELKEKNKALEKYIEVVKKLELLEGGIE